MSITNVDNHFIHYEVLGRGQPIIFLHGWLGSWRYWWPAMQGLSTQFRAFAFDLWGFGDSSKVREEDELATLYSLQGYVEMLDQFIEQLGIKQPVILVGHALGAAVALHYASQYAAKVERVAAVSLPITSGTIHERLANMDPIGFVTRVLGKTGSFDEVNGEIRKTDLRAMQQLAVELSQLNLAPMLTVCACPLLVVTGDKDIVVQLPADIGQTMALSANGRRHFVTLPDCNHFPMLQETAKFNRLLLEFIHAGDDLSQLALKEYWQRRIR